MTKIMTHDNGNLAVAIINGRRYVACNVPVGHAFCGELIDVTDIDITADTDIDCGNQANHRDPLDYRMFGVDAIVP